MDDTVKAATDALYEAIKAKVLKDMEQCKEAAKAARTTEERNAINNFITSTFVRNPVAPPISVREMHGYFIRWCEQSLRNSEYMSLTNPIALISMHPWAERELYKDFTGLELIDWDVRSRIQALPPYNPNDILRPMPLVLPAPAAAAPEQGRKPQRRPKKTNI